jgi:hypothetical protein
MEKTKRIEGLCTNSGEMKVAKIQEGVSVNIVRTGYIMYILPGRINKSS